VTAGQSLAEGTAGIALLHLETGNRAAAHAALEQAVADGVSVAASASLYADHPYALVVQKGMKQADRIRSTPYTSDENVR